MTSFIAEINIPIVCHMPPNKCHRLENPTYFGVKRGYWRLALRPDEIGNDKSSGIDLVMELNAESIEGAEDAALDAGKSLSLFFTVFAGQPSMSPLLNRLAEIGPSEGIIEQRKYYYESNGADLTTMEMTPWKFSSFLRRITQQPHETRALLEMAIRWYSIGITANDSLDSYFAFWIGLEALCESLAERYHPKGYESCQLCQGASLEASKAIRRKKDIGDLLAINHLIVRVAHELLMQQSIVDLKNLRNFVAHPDRFIRKGKSLDDVREEIKPLLQDIQLCLATAVLNLVNPPQEDPGAVTLWGTPRLESHPYGMVWLRSDTELDCYDPWSGKWVKE